MYNCQKWSLTIRSMLCQTRRHFHASSAARAKQGMDFFKTKRGQGASFVLFAFIGGSAVMLKQGPNTFLIDIAQSVLQYKDDNGNPCKPSKDLIRVLKLVMDDLGVIDENLLKTRAFIAKSNELKTLGAYISNYGQVRIGIPQYFNFDATSHVTIESMRFFALKGDQESMWRERREKSSPTYSEADKSFLEAAKLSDDAKKFALAREVYRSLGTSQQQDMAVSCSALIWMYSVSRLINRSLDLLKGPLSFRIGQYFLNGAVTTLLYFTVKDFIQGGIEKDLDVAACQVSPTYALGGIEFYSKQIARNVALRNVLPGDQGKKIFNLKGEYYPSLIRPYKNRSFASSKQLCADQMHLHNANLI